MSVAAADRLGVAGADAGIRTEAFAWRVLDARLGTAGDIAPVLADNPTITASIGGSVGRRVTGVHLTATDAAAIDPARDWLQATYTTLDGTTEALGTFRIAAATTTDRSPGTHRGADTVALDLADGSVRHGARIHRAVGFERDTAIDDAVARLADWLRIPDYRVDPTVAEIGTPLAWALGETTWAEVAAAVAKAGGMLAPFFDRTGTWRWKVAPDYETATPDHAYRHDDGTLLAGGAQRSVALLDDPNVWYAVAAGGRDAVRGRWALPAAAPNSIARIGYEIPEVVDAAGAASDDAAVRTARAAAIASDAAVAPAVLRCPFDPTAELYDLVSYDGWRWRSLGHVTELAPGSPLVWNLARVWAPGDAEGTMLGGIL